MSLVKRRCVIAIGDYDASDVPQQFAQFQHEAQQFARTWNVNVRSSSFAMQAGNAVAVWVIESKGPNWTVETEYRLLNWSDLAKPDITGWNWQAIWRALTAGANFMMSAALFHYVRSNWRFALLLSYPLLLALCTVVLGLLFSDVLAGLGLPFALLAGFALSAAVVVAVVWRFDHGGFVRVLNLWIFLHGLVYLKRLGLAERLGVFAHELVEQLRHQDADEILIVGHGFGAALLPIVVDRAFWQLPEFGKDGRSVNVLTAGSLLLAVGLHPEADWLVGPVSRVARDRMVFWTEYQARDDVLNFPGLNPTKQLISDHGKPVLRSVALRHMLDKAPKRGLVDAVFQRHQQWMRANTRRCAYDFFMICCGPLPLSHRTKQAGRVVSCFASDGRLDADEHANGEKSPKPPQGPRLRIDLGRPQP